MIRLSVLILSTVFLVSCAGDFHDDYPLAPGGGSGGGSGGDGSGSQGPSYPTCEPTAAPSLFTNALCICEDLNDIGAILVRKGVTKDPATMGLNGSFKVINHSGIDGSLVAYGGLKAIANVDVKQNVVSNGNVEFTGRLAAGKDLMVGGNLTGLGALQVGGVLGVNGSQNLLGGKSIGTVGAYKGPAGPPCACGANQVINVKAEVSKARNSNNNAAAGLPGAPVNTIGANKLVLNSGSYYFGNKKSIGYAKVVVNGAVKIYVDGDLDSIGHDRFDIQSGSTLDLYVSGNVRTVGHMVYGDRHHPAAFRLYIGGNQQATMQVGNQVFHGAIYAPNATLAYVGRTKIEGSLLAKTLSSVGLLELYFARPTTNGSGEKCTPPGGSPPPDKKPDDPPDPKDLPDIENM
jgi:hypothetical protein